MDDPIHSADVRFVGDLDDPWVVEIAETLPSGSTRVHSSGDLTDASLGPCDLLVIQRRILTRHDAERLRRYRLTRIPSPRILLCHGPHVRYEDLTRWTESLDAVIHEATALETLPRLVRTLLGGDEPLVARRPTGFSPVVTVVSTNFALRQTLREAVETLGYRATAARDFSSATPKGITLWDVPWLEPDWPREIAGRANDGPLIALLGFADRALVREARKQGASACLELPLDLADLAFTLERLVNVNRNVLDAAHEVPPSPALSRLHSLSRAKIESRLDHQQ